MTVMDSKAKLSKRNKEGYYIVKPVNSIKEMLKAAKDEAGDWDAYQYRIPDDPENGIRHITYKEFYETTENLGAALTDMGLGNAHIACLVFRLAMEFAYKERAIPLLNWDLIEYPKELGIKKVNSLSKDQEQALIQCIYMDLNRKTAGILIALFTGIRIGELCGLQMKDISLTDKTININKTVQRIYDKRKGSSYLHIGPPKTKTSARVIPVPSLLMNIIKKFYTENPNHYFLTGKTKPTEPRTYRQFFTRFLKRNGLQKVKFHEIRHTFAVRAIEIPEFDIKSLSEILGHKNVSFTLNVYGSANLQQKVKCMNLLNDLL